MVYLFIDFSLMCKRILLQGEICGKILDRKSCVSIAITPALYICVMDLPEIPCSGRPSLGEK